MQLIKEIKRFLEYILYRIFRHGVSVMSSKNEKWRTGGYIYLLILLSLPISVILSNFFFDMFNKLFSTNVMIEQDDHRRLITKLKGLIPTVPVMLVLYFLLPRRYIESLEYTKEESKRYRNIFLIVFLPPVLWFFYGLFMHFYHLHD